MSRHSERRTKNWEFCRAFTMVELLIAIMILGLGLTMIATIFPVGLDITRDTVEKSIALAAADFAVETIKLKVPTAHDEILNVSRPGGTYPWPPATSPPAPVVLLPRDLIQPADPVVLLLDPTRNPLNVGLCGIENNADITATEARANTDFSGRPIPGYPCTDYFFDPPTGQALPAMTKNITNPTTRDDMLTHSRVYTEWSFWDGDPPPPNPPNPAVTYNPAVSYVVPGQNVAIDAQTTRLSAANSLRPVLTNEFTPRFTPDGTLPYLGPSRLHLTEQIFPPIRVETLTPSASLVQPALLGVTGIDNLTSDPTKAPRFVSEAKVASAAADRHYSWTVLQHRLTQNHTFGLTIVVTSRGDLNSAYAYQGDQRSPPPLYGTPFDLTPANFGGTPDKDPTNSLFLPQAVLETDRTKPPTGSPPPPDLQDGLFPRPWLVALGLPPNINPIPPAWKVTLGNGQVLCTAEVARLLPAGAHFIVALDSANWPVGRVVRVRTSTWKMEQLGKAPDQQEPARLQLDSGVLPAAGVLLIWVFPPAVTAHPPNGTKGLGDFGERSPVIAAFERQVTLP